MAIILIGDDILVENIPSPHIHGQCEWQEDDLKQTHRREFDFISNGDA